MGWRVGTGMGLSLLLCAGSAAWASVQPERLWTEARRGKLERQRSELARVAKRAMPAVVAISTRSAEGGEGEESSKGLGSGFIIHPDGYIVTSSHVVEEVREVVVRVQSPQGRLEEYPASMVGNDPHTDIALLKIDAGRKLPVLPLASADDVEVADWVVVIGNPFGLPQSVTVGVVSFKGRTDVVPSGREGFFEYLQTDASINPGNSGGPMLDLRGFVVAVANAVNVSGQGIGFGIPIDTVKAVVPRLKEEGSLRRGWLGISVEDLTPDLASALGEESYSGVVVVEVEKESPAERVGLEVGDVIGSVGERAVRSAHQLRWEITIAGPGRSLALEVRRDGLPRQLRATLEQAREQRPPPTHLSLGASVSEVDLNAAKLAGLASPYGALVRSVDRDSPLDRAGLAQGDVVLKVNDRDIGTQEELLRAVERLSSGQLVRFYVRRGPATVPLSLRAP